MEMNNNKKTMKNEIFQNRDLIEEYGGMGQDDDMTAEFDLMATCVLLYEKYQEPMSILMSPEFYDAFKSHYRRFKQNTDEISRCKLLNFIMDIKIIENGERNIFFIMENRTGYNKVIKLSYITLNNSDGDCWAGLNRHG